jgi:hypothetical protein
MPSARSAKKQEFVQHSICIESLQSDVQVNEYGGYFDYPLAEKSTKAR